jgi:hypothetical protein
MGSLTVAQAIVDIITDKTGLHATVDPRDVYPPCAIVEPPTVDLDTMCGGTGEFEVTVVVPGPWNADAWSALDTATQALIPLLNVERVRPATYPNPDGTLAPAVALTVVAPVEY